MVLLAMAASISALRRAYTGGLVMTWRRMARMDVAVVSDPANLSKKDVS